MRRFLLALFFALPGPAAGAQDAPPGPELRLGLVAHDVAGAEAGAISLAGDALLAIPGAGRAGRLAPFLPRLQIGAILNPSGRTSLAHAGLAWQFDLAGGFFLEAALGLAVHDGATGRASPPGHAALGCRLLFREAGGLGYRLGGGWQVIASLEHFSNGGACARNRGLTHAGLRLGYQF